MKAPIVRGLSNSTQTKVSSLDWKNKIRKKQIKENFKCPYPNRENYYT